MAKYSVDVGNWDKGQTILFKAENDDDAGRTDIE